MRLDVPFYENNEANTACAQAAMRMAINYILGKDYSLEELDVLTGRKDPYYTYCTQIVVAFEKLGLKSYFYMKGNLEPYLKGEEFFKEIWKAEDFKNFKKVTDFDVFTESVRGCLEKGLYRKVERFGVDEIKEEMDKGRLVIVWVDVCKLLKNQEATKGHFLLITGYDDENLYYHESGRTAEPEKNRGVSIERFIDAASIDGEFVDMVVVWKEK